MVFLSNLAIKRAFTTCLERSNYRVNIAVNSSRMLHITISVIEKQIEDHDYYPIKRKSTSNSYWVAFENGSTIDIFFPRESVRGNRCHFLIVDKDVKEEVIRTVLMPREMQYIHNNYAGKDDSKMTQPQELSALVAVTEERDKLKEEVKALKLKIEKMESEAHYYQGITHALAFAVRCDSVSGDEVPIKSWEADNPWCF